MTGNWHINLLSNVLKQDTMSRIKLPTSTQVDKRNAQREYHYTRYKHAFDVITQYNNREPISVVFFRDGGCGAMLDNGTEYVQISFKSKTIVIDDLHYWAITINGTHVMIDNDTEIANYCLLLPQLSKGGLPKPGQLDTRYTIIDSAWLDAKPRHNSKSIDFVIPNIKVT